MFTSRWSCHVLGLAALGAGLLGAAPANAHFVLQSPPAAAEQGPLGDPQKAPPCGDDGSTVATGMVTSYQAGDVVTITIDETIFHPGHYRIALALNDVSELPDEPPVTANNTACGSAPIQDPPVFPVLADGVFVHTEPFDEPQTIDITLPADVSCDNCTLQVIQFMSNHGLNNPGGCFYHHCATISVEGVQAATTTGADESGGEGTAGTSVTTTATSAATTTATTAATTTATTATSQGETASDETSSDEGTGSGATGPTTGSGGGSTSGTPGTGTGTGATSDGSGSDGGDGGCGCSGTPGGQGSATLVALLGLLGLRARRRSVTARAD